MESMKLPGRTQGNPDAGLWAADIAHFVQRDIGGRKGEVETEIKQSGVQLAPLLSITDHILTLV